MKTLIMILLCLVGAFILFIFIEVISTIHSYKKVSDDKIINLMKQDYGENYFIKLASEVERSIFARNHFKELNLSIIQLGTRVEMIIEHPEVKDGEISDEIEADEHVESKDDSKDIFGI